MRKWILEETGEERIIHPGEAYLYKDSINRWVSYRDTTCSYPFVKLTELKTVDDRCEVIRIMLDEIKKG